jgi:hypothetical protein
MRDVNVTRLDVIAALRSRIIETVNNTQKLGYPPNPEDIFDRVCGFVSGQVSVPLRPTTRGWLYCPMSRLSSKPRLVIYSTSGTSNYSERSTP